MSNFIDEKKIEEDLLKKEASLVSKRYEEIVMCFVCRMFEVKPNFDFTNLKKNIKSLKVWTIPFFFRDQEDSIGAIHDFHINKIFLSNKEDSSLLYYAFMHMASTKISDVNSGFRKRVSDTLDCGNGLNRGYTKLITERYFWDQCGSSQPNLEMYFAQELERIVGKEKMEELYFNADFDGLQQEVCKYTSESDFLQFIHNIDLLATKRDATLEWLRGEKALSGFSDIEEVAQSMGNFLNLTYIKKQKSLFSTGDIDFDTYYKNIGKCLDKINNESIKIGVVTLWSCNKVKMEKELEKIGIKVEFFEQPIYRDESKDDLLEVQWTLIKR